MDHETLLKVEARIALLLKELSPTLTPTQLAKHILHQSDFYIQNPETRTPWTDNWCQLAQLGYYFPLNLQRNFRLMKEAQSLNFFRGVREVVEFGAGLAPSTWALQHLSEATSDLSFSWIETSMVAKGLAAKLLPGLKVSLPGSIEEVSERRHAERVFICSYALTESMDNAIMREMMKKADHFILIEPSTRDDGRALLEKRDFLIQNGFHIWAPCTHQGPCPLLKESKTDWCHDRVHTLISPRMQELEKILPIKNQTLTMSYLIASRRAPPATTKVRVVGDALNEKGKMRQMICRSSSREFLTRLTRKGPLPELSRGDLFELPPEHKTVANEIRLD